MSGHTAYFPIQLTCQCWPCKWSYPYVVSLMFSEVFSSSKLMNTFVSLSEFNAQKSWKDHTIVKAFSFSLVWQKSWLGEKIHFSNLIKEPKHIQQDISSSIFKDQKEKFPPAAQGCCQGSSSFALPRRRLVNDYYKMGRRMKSLHQNSLSLFLVSCEIVRRGEKAHKLL